MQIFYISIITVFASMVGTMTGFGTSTIMVPILSMFFPITEVLLFVGIIHFFGDIWKILLFRKGFEWKLILSFGIPGIIFAFLGAKLTFQISNDILTMVLGIFMISYVVFLFAKSTFKLPKNTLVASSGGAISGFMAGIFGIGGAVRGMALTTFDLPKATYIATAGAIAFFTDITRISTYLLSGSKLNLINPYGLILFIPLSFLGAKIAKMIVDRIPQNYFKYFIGLFLVLVGLKLIFFGH